MTELGATTIDTAPVDHPTAAHIEATEAEAWADMYAAVPPDFAEQAGISAREVAGVLVIEWAATGRRYFSRVIGLGVVEPATEAAIEEILLGYERAGITMFLLQGLPHCEPGAYEQWLKDRGLEPFDAQARVVRGGEPLTHELGVNSGRELTVNRVTGDDADEWSEFLQRVYKLDTGSWLGRLYDRPGWHQYVAREAGSIVGARGMFISHSGTAWLGMDGPVPGVHSNDYEPDAALCQAMVADGLALGATGFIADIEAPSEEMDTPAYRYFGQLGFTLPYTRTHWTRL
jgi:hypothetical protein